MTSDELLFFPCRREKEAESRNGPFQKVIEWVIRVERCFQNQRPLNECEFRT